MKAAPFVPQKATQLPARLGIPNSWHLNVKKTVWKVQVRTGRGLLVGDYALDHNYIRPRVSVNLTYNSDRC